MATTSGTATRTSNPDLQLLVEGKPVKPQMAKHDLAIFKIPKKPTKLRIVSRTAVPAEVKPGSTDNRKLGIGILKIILRSKSMSLEIDYSDAVLKDGFYPADRGCRWTNGDAGLSADLFTHLAGEVTLELRIGNLMSYAI